MSPLLENLLVSIVTGIVASATFLISLDPTAPRDIAIIISNGVIAFGGSFINGMRQLHMKP